MASCLRHPAHPLEFGAIEVVGACYLSPFVVEAFLTFFQIIGVIATIGVYGLVVEFEYHGTDTIEEEAVMGHHQQRSASASQIAFEPLNHLKIQVVGGLIKYQQIWLRQQHIGQCHALLLTTRELPHRLLQVADLKLRKYLFGLQHLLGIALMIEAGIEDTLLGVEHGRLLQHPYLQIATEDDTARIIALLAGKHG